MTSVLPPFLWKRDDIGKTYFNTQVALAKAKRLRVSRIFLVKDDDHSEYRDDVVQMHKEAGLEISFVKVNEKNHFQDFVIIKGLGVIHAPELSEAMWTGLCSGKSAEEIWESVKEKTGRFYSLNHVEAKKCRDLFKQLNLRDPI